MNDPASPSGPSPPPNSVDEPRSLSKKGDTPGSCRVVLCVTGSIAAFKAPVIARLLGKAGADVDVVLSHCARQFIGPATFSGITGRPVLGSMFDERLGGELHVALGTERSLIVIAPATADLLARLAQGRADDTIAAAVLCARCPVLIAPAMHPAMWKHPATSRNVEVLRASDRIEFVGPVHGEVATGEVGVGRMAEPEHIVARALRRLAPGDLSLRRIVVSAGPTAEDLDPIRFLGNRSSGKMGFALAERALARGAEVTVVSGPVHLPTPPGVRRVDVRSAVAMRGAIWQALGPDLSRADALIMAAAVSDYRPAETCASKLKRSASSMTLELVQNPDILAEVGESRQGRQPVLVGFAAETAEGDALIEYARTKLSSKRVDLIVANPADQALGRDDNQATLVTADSAEALGPRSKLAVADRILDWLVSRFSEFD